jgi:hypothetical protein
MNARTKTNIRFNGREYANADDMPVDVRAAYDRAVDEMPPLHSGARLAAKLNAKIIVNRNEFNNAGEMSVDDRHCITKRSRHCFRRILRCREPEEISRKKSCQSWWRSGAAYVGLHGFFG